MVGLFEGKFTGADWGLIGSMVMCCIACLAAVGVKLKALLRRFPGRADEKIAG